MRPYLLCARTHSAPALTLRPHSLCAHTYSAPTLTLRPHLLYAHTYSTPILTLRPHLLYACTDILLSQAEIFERHMRHLSRLFLHHRPKSTLYQSVPASSTSACSQATCDIQPQLHQVPTSFYTAPLFSLHHTSAHCLQVSDTHPPLPPHTLAGIFTTPKKEKTPLPAA
jgi:hypothetical protein